MRPNLKFVIVLVPVLIVSAFVGLACSDDDDDGNTPAASPTTAAAAVSPTSGAATSPTSAAGASGNNITISNFSYSPGRFNARAGQAVRLTVANQDSAPHTFTIDGIVDSGRLAAGETKVIEFTPPAAGNFTYYCTVHGQTRMSGQLMVAGTVGAVPSDPPGSGQTTSSSSDASYGY